MNSLTNLPELAFGLFDQALHAAAGVEQDGDLHQRFLVSLRGLTWLGSFAQERG